MAIRNGNTLNIVSNGDRIANARTVSLDITNNLVEVTTQPSRGFVERISGNRTGVLSFDGLYDVTEADVEAGTLVSWRFRGQDGTYYGDGYVSLENYSGGVDDAPVRSGTIETTGPINFARQVLDTLCVNGVTLCVDGQELTARV